MGNPRTGKVNKVHKQDKEGDLREVLWNISMGFILIENNTALEHPKGGYKKISKTITNTLESNKIYTKVHLNKKAMSNHLNKIKEKNGVYAVHENTITYFFKK